MNYFFITPEDAKRKLRIESEALDRQIAEDEPCPECGATMHYENIRTETSYRAFAVCDNSECGERIEF